MKQLGSTGVMCFTAEVGTQCYRLEEFLREKESAQDAVREGKEEGEVEGVQAHQVRMRVRGSL